MAHSAPAGANGKRGALFALIGSALRSEHARGALRSQDRLNSQEKGHAVAISACSALPTRQIHAQF
jgi:hypothetical protein